MLIIQFPGNSEEDFEKLIKLEEKLEAELKSNNIADGHDFGSGEMNIFILTNSPNVIAQKVVEIINQTKSIPFFRIAYREIDGNDYIILYPSQETDFKVK